MNNLPLQQTPLHSLHLELGGKMVPFAGYAMPVQYPMGILKEHLHTRTQAGLFDVSHMGQLRIRAASYAHAALALEKLVPIDVLDLAPGQQRYALFTNDTGGILDDLMITRVDDHLFLIVNAACKAADLAHLQQEIGNECTIETLPTHALLALQGPQAVAVLQRLLPTLDLSGWLFMRGRTIELAGVSCFATRSGYTGEDGFEISIPTEHAASVARCLLAQAEVAPIGLGARDSLRLEASLCLYGHELDSTTSPVEANLSWALSKARRTDGARAGGYPGAARILAELHTPNTVTRKRVGLLGQEKVPVREGTLLVNHQGQTIGQVTSGGVSPSLAEQVGYAVPIALAYIATPYSNLETEVFAVVRGKQLAMRVTQTPFVPQRYYRGKP